MEFIQVKTEDTIAYHAKEKGYDFLIYPPDQQGAYWITCYWENGPTPNVIGTVNLEGVGATPAEAFQALRDHLQDRGRR